MKLIAMHIDNFGGLHDYDYTFDEGLNVVLHDNGWGKTTMAAFLKAMLYGYDTRRSKDITQNERKRYQPWQGGKYGGYLDFESEGVAYRVYRTFGETARFDTAKVIRLDTNTAARIPADQVGETLFHLDASAFQRSVFINQNGLSLDGAASSIHTRLNALVSQANDVAAYDGAIAQLTGQVKVYEKSGARGQLGEITRRIEELERVRDQYERDILAQDAARARIVQIDGLRGGIDRTLAEKSARLDAVSGESKEREAAQKMLDDLQLQMAACQREMAALEGELGGQVPSDDAVEQIKRREQTLDALKKGIGELSEDREKAARSLEELASAYGGRLPDAAQLDEIQAVYGEMQGLLSAGTEAAAEMPAPEAYALIQAAQARTGDFVRRLQAAVDSQPEIQRLIRQQDAQRRDLQAEGERWAGQVKQYRQLQAEKSAQEDKLRALQRWNPEALTPAIHQLEACQANERTLTQAQAQLRAQLQRESEAWSEKRRRHEALKREADGAREALNGLAAYEEQAVRPAIDQLEELRRAQQRVEAQRESLPTLRLSDGEAALLAAHAGELPDAGEGGEILQRQRDALRHQAAAQGLSARLDGERSKAGSLSASLTQLEAVTAVPLEAVQAPKKPASAVLMGLGIVLILAGIALGVGMNPALGGIAALGALLIVLAITGKSGYQKKAQAYEASQQAAAQRREVERQSADTRAELTRAEADIAALEGELAEHQRAVDENGAAVSAWLARWGDGGEEASEAAIARILDDAAEVQRLRTKRENCEAAQRAIDEQTARIEAERRSVDARCPECAGKPLSQAVDILRAGATRYQIAKDKWESARRALKQFVSDSNLTEAQLAQPESPAMPPLSRQIQKAAADLENVQKSRREVNAQFPELQDLPYEGALKLLREKQGEYQVAESRCQTARRALERFVQESGASASALEGAALPLSGELEKACAATSRALEQRLHDINALLIELDLDCDGERLIPALIQAGEYLNVYRQHDGRLKDVASRQSRQREQLDALQKRLAGLLREARLSENIDDLPARLSSARAHLADAAQLRARMADLERELQKQQKSLESAQAEIAAFARRHGHFDAEAGDILSGICDRASRYAQRRAACAQLERQAAPLEAEAKAPTAASAEEIQLRAEVDDLNARRDELIVEYTQRGEFIRRADSSLEKYPDLQREIQSLYAQKQKAQSAVAILKRTIQLITRAKENLANRYLSKVEQLFNSYMQVWLNNDAVRGLLDINFNVSIEENDDVHVAEGYSTGTCDMIDFCMRLALVDTLFEKEQPFLILDDPFVNLDAERLNKALELLNVMAASKQVIYFVCHPIRAVETEENAASREALEKLAEATRKTIHAARAEGAQPGTPRKSPREMYRLVQSAAPLALKPARPDYTITNSIFSMPFELTEAGAARDGVYELFFIDTKGRVLNDRQLIEVSGGKLSTDRVRFSLNTRDDSGDTYELMIRESGQDDYDIVARYPFRAKLAFAGTYNFGF